MTPPIRVPTPPAQSPGPPWSWSVADLGQHLTAAQREALLARFRKLGYVVTAWPDPTPTPQGADLP